MGTLGRALAICASVGVHLALVLCVFLLGRASGRLSPSEALSGSVEIGVVYTERPRAPAEPQPSPPAAPRLARRIAERAGAPKPAPTPVSTAVPGQSGAPEDEPEQGTVPIAPSAESGEVEGSGAGGGSGGGRGVGAAAEDGAGSGAGNPAGPDESAALAEMARRLAESAQRCYPRAAARLRAQGVVQIRFCVGEAGQPRDGTIVVSSGVELLDEAALGCVLAKAAPLPATRECVSVPVRFRLVP